MAAHYLALLLLLPLVFSVPILGEVKNVEKVVTESSKSRSADMGPTSGERSQNGRDSDSHGEQSIAEKLLPPYKSPAMESGAEKLLPSYKGSADESTSDKLLPPYKTSANEPVAQKELPPYKGSGDQSISDKLLPPYKTSANESIAEKLVPPYKSSDNESVADKMLPPIKSAASKSLEAVGAQRHDQPVRRESEEASAVGGEPAGKPSSGNSPVSSASEEADGKEPEEFVVRDHSDEETENLSTDGLEEDDIQAKLVGLLREITRNMVESIRSVFSNRTSDEPESALSKEVTDEEERS